MIVLQAIIVNQILKVTYYNSLLNVLQVLIVNLLEINRVLIVQHVEKVNIVLVVILNQMVIVHLNSIVAKDQLCKFLVIKIM